MLLALYPILPEDGGAVFALVAGLNLLVFIAGYVLSIMLTHRALRLRGISGWGGTLATMPVYWLLMSGAAWLALWQFMTAPFHWNKTEHGLSRLQGGRRRWPVLARFRRAARRGSG